MTALGGRAGAWEVERVPGRLRGCLGDESIESHVDVHLESVQDLLALVRVGIVVI